MNKSKVVCSVVVVLVIAVVVAVTRRDGRVQGEPLAMGHDAATASGATPSYRSAATRPAAARDARNETQDSSSLDQISALKNSPAVSAQTEARDTDANGVGDPAAPANPERVLPGPRPATTTTDQIDRLIERSEIVSIRNVFTEETGDRLKSTLIETSMKYPHVLIEETLSPDGRRISVRAMAADHA